MSKQISGNHDGSAQQGALNLAPTPSDLLNDLPAELDPDYVAPVEASIARAPRGGDWVNFHRAVPNGDEGFRRGDGPLLGQVTDCFEEGCFVRLWSRPHMKFIELIFIPSRSQCIISRAAVNHYSLTGNWPAHWRIATEAA